MTPISAPTSIAWLGSTTTKPSCAGSVWQTNFSSQRKRRTRTQWFLIIWLHSNRYFHTTNYNFDKTLDAMPGTMSELPYLLVFSDWNVYQTPRKVNRSCHVTFHLTILKDCNFFVFQSCELRFSGISDPVLIHSFPESFLVNPSPGGGTTVGYIFKKHNFSLNLKISFFLNMHCSGTPLEMDLQEKTPEIDVS